MTDRLLHIQEAADHLGVPSLVLAAACGLKAVDHINTPDGIHISESALADYADRHQLDDFTADFGDEFGDIKDGLWVIVTIALVAAVALLIGVSLGGQS